MIAIDTSSFRRYLSGEKGRDVQLVAEAIAEGAAVLPPPVLCEILSDPALPLQLASDLAGLPLLEVRDGFWERAGLLRVRVIGKGRKARLADALIAQFCIDHSVPLVTHDRDFRHFSSHGLDLA